MTLLTCDLHVGEGRVSAGGLVVVPTCLLELHVEILAHLDVLEHARQLVHVVCRHSYFLYRNKLHRYYGNMNMRASLFT